ncbi:MAG: serine/threonine-protein kinase [Nannocystaceae bacterium]|nr:serine/threonine-protein kinase [Nannocystaceae bacterium]
MSVEASPPAPGDEPPTLALDTVELDTDDGRTAPPLLLRGASLGRYLLVECVGRGGMGQVFRAYDPKLHREVALKLLRPGRDDGSEEARVVREARSMAQLSHPNVVAVYDVERVDEHLFIAMEFVAGVTLQRWLAAQPRSTDAVLEVMQQAAAGLAVAHEAGLVHRDFKPANVMVGDDGRVRVMDFGLARHGGDASASASGATLLHPRDASDSLSAALTQHGAVLGTPAYMAPEQHRGEPIDGRCDQFAFCVTLFEALWRTRPFVGDTAEALIAAKLAGPPRAPTGTGVPAWLVQVLQRGLQPDPARRWPSMRALQQALSNSPTALRRRRLRIATGAAVVGVLAAGWLVAGARRERACAEDPLASSYDDGRRAAIGEAFAATSLGYADEAAAHVIAGLDRHAEHWRDAWQRECLAPQIPAHSAVATCLQRERLRFDALLDTLTHDVDARTVQRAATAVAALGRPADCTRAPGGHADAPELAAALARADASMNAGQVELAQAALDDAARALAAIAGPGAEAGAGAAELALARALLAQELTDFAQAERHGFDAWTLALTAGRDDLAARAAVVLVRAVGSGSARRDEGERWRRQGAAMLARIDTDGPIAIELALAQAELELFAAKTDAALSSAQRAVALAEHVFGLTDLWTARATNQLANVYDTLGETALAAAAYERAITMLEQGLGPHHPDVARPLGNLGNVAMGQGDPARALSYYERAIALMQRGVGREHVRVAMLDYNAADALASLGREAEARARLERAIETLTEAYGAEHTMVAYPLTTLGRMLAEAGDVAGARARLEAALAIRERNHEAPALLAETRLVLAEVLREDPAARARAEALVDASERACRDRPEATCKHALQVVAAWRARDRPASPQPAGSDAPDP